ncbi:anti-sigma factor domain-containing protein [Cytobacillus oceanisediminis]|uniref:anti-sigma factor domain-containing protein n=1 Tax=Cytobacillus oceanisediminis TaxID=665099 RepID=UPI003735E07A
MKTGIIMEINERFLTLLTPEGEFLRARKQDRAYVLGQEIDFFPIEQKSGKKSSSLSIMNVFRGKAVFAAAFALMLAVISFLPFYQSNEVYAYMSIDVNPSIELGVNEKYQVIELVPYNEDGERIVQKIQDWKKEDIQSVTDKILYQLKEQGYLGDNKEIVIAAVYTEEKIEADDRLRAELTEIKEAAQKKQLEVTLFEASEEERKSAIEKGLTTGLYKENKLKADSKKQSEKEKPASASQPKEADSISNDSKKPDEIPPGQLNKQEKPAVNQGKLNEKKTAAPGQIQKNEQEGKQNSSEKNNEKKDIEHKTNENSEKGNNEKKNKQNEWSQNNGDQSNDKHINGNNGNGNNPEKQQKDNGNKK